MHSVGFLEMERAVCRVDGETSFVCWLVGSMSCETDVDVIVLRVDWSASHLIKIIRVHWKSAIFTEHSEKQNRNRFLVNWSIGQLVNCGFDDNPNKMTGLNSVFIKWWFFINNVWLLWWNGIDFSWALVELVALNYRWCSDQAWKIPFGNVGVLINCTGGG